MSVNIMNISKPSATAIPTLPPNYLLRLRLSKI